MKYIRRSIYSILIFLTSNIPLLYFGVQEIKYWVGPFILFFLLILIFPAYSKEKIPDRRLRVCANGSELLIYFLVSAVLSSLYILGLLPFMFRLNPNLWIANFICMLVCGTMVFWAGIIRVYRTSAQLNTKWKAAGIICGWIPVLRIIVLLKIIYTANKEWKSEY